MKLYTEEELKKFMQKHVILDELTLSLLTPIGLPSDEEIEQIALDFAKKYRATTYEISALTIGAKWMRDKIEGQ